MAKSELQVIESGFGQTARQRQKSITANNRTITRSRKLPAYY